MTTRVSTPNDRDVVLTREFRATSTLVFRALTEPDLLRRWYGPTGWTLVQCEIDLRVGGRWYFVVKRPDGKRIGQLGLYREIVPGRRLVNTESWQDWDAGETLVTTVLTERNGITLLESTCRFPSPEVRDIVLKSGLGPNVEEGYRKLAALVENPDQTMAGGRDTGR